MTLGGWEERANASSSNSPSQASSTVSAQKFKQWVEGSMNADVFGNAVVVGYAAYRPGADPNEDLAGSGGEMGQVNELDGTLEESDVYKTFIERFEREKREQEEGGKPVTVGLEVRGEVQKTSLMEFVERKFRKNQRPKTTKAKVRKGKSEGRDGRAVQAGQGGQTSQARGKSQPQKGRGGGRGSGRGRGGGGQKGRKGQGPVAQGAGSLPSKDSSAQAGRQAKGQSQASVSGKNPPWPTLRVAIQSPGGQSHHGVEGREARRPRARLPRGPPKSTSSTRTQPRSRDFPRHVRLMSHPYILRVVTRGRHIKPSHSTL